MKKFFIFVITAFAVIFASCSQNLLLTGSSIEIKLPGGNDRSIVKFTEGDVSNFTITVTGKDYLKEKNAKPGDYIIFEELEAGTYTVNVKAYDINELLAAEGSDDVVVEPGKTSTADVYALLGYKSEFFLMSEKGVQYTDANLKTVLREPKGFFNHTKSAVDFGAEYVDIPSDKSGTVSRDEPVREEPYVQTFVKINDNTIDKVSLAKILKIKTNTKTTVEFNIKAENPCNVTVEYRNEKNSRCVYKETRPVTTVSTIQYINLSQYNFGLENTPETTGLFTITIPREAGKVTVSDFDLPPEDDETALPPPCAYTVTDAVSVVTEAGSVDGEPYNSVAFTFDKNKISNDSCGYITGIPIEKNKMTKVSFFLETDADIISDTPEYDVNGQIKGNPANNLQIWPEIFAGEKGEKAPFATGKQYLSLMKDGDENYFSVFIPGYFLDASMNYEIASIKFMVFNTDCTLTVSTINIETIDLTDPEYAPEEIEFAILGPNDYPSKYAWYVPARMQSETNRDIPTGRYYYDIPICNNQEKKFEIMVFDPHENPDDLYDTTYRWHNFCAFRGFPVHDYDNTVLEVSYKDDYAIGLKNISGGDILVRVWIDPNDNFKISLTNECYPLGSGDSIIIDHRIINQDDNNSDLIGVWYPQISGDFTTTEPLEGNVVLNIEGWATKKFNGLELSIWDWGDQNNPINQVKSIEFSNFIKQYDADFYIDNYSIEFPITENFNPQTTTFVLSTPTLSDNGYTQQVQGLEISSFMFNLQIKKSSAFAF